MESNNLTEKLNTFTSLVLKDAEQKREKLLENVQKEYSERIDAKENELLQGAYENIQQNIQSAQKSANERVLHAELDSKKKLMQNFCIAYRGILSKNNLYATGTTGRLIEEVANLSVHKYLAGHLGGIQQLGAQIEHNDIDLVIFLRDPLKPKPHEPEVNSIFRICDEHNIPLATNLATAELLILSLDRGDLDWREMYK